MNFAAPIRTKRTESTYSAYHAKARKLPCEIPGCKELCSINKPYCINHLDKYDYVQNIYRELNSYEEEISKISETNGWKKIKIDGMMSKEIIGIVKNKGVIALEQLTSAADIKEDALKNYLKKLEKEKILKTINIGSRRGGFRQVITLYEFKS